MDDTKTTIDNSQSLPLPGEQPGTTTGPAETMDNGDSLPVAGESGGTTIGPAETESTKISDEPKGE